MDWNDIFYVCKVVEHGSFSAAARACNTTQATISRRIQKIEQEIGSSLFIRLTEGVELTNAGKELYQHASAMGSAYQSFEKKLYELMQGSQTIVITCGSLIGLHLSKHIQQLNYGLKDIEIEIKTTNAFLDLNKNEADLALRNKRPQAGSLLAKKLDAQNYGKFSVFGNRRIYAKHNLSFDEVKQLDWISYTLKSSDAPSAQWIQKNIEESQVKYRLNSALMIYEALRENNAVGLLPQFIGRAAPELVELYGPVDGLDFELWSVRRESSRNDPNLVQLIANIESIFSNNL